MGATESKEEDKKDEEEELGIYCKIIIVGPKSGDHSLTELRWLPKDAHILGTGSSIEELDIDNVDVSSANVLLNANGNAASLAPIIQRMPRLEWIHSMTAGLDHILFPELVEDDGVIMTNAKGIFSSSLAEYVMGVCTYFSKDFPRLMRQKNEHKWEKYCVTELRGQTMGILGYGDIGKACAILAKAYGMRVIAMRRRPEMSAEDPLIDEIFGPEGIESVMSLSDYVVVVAALTADTKGMVDSKALAAAKPGQILINIGRGPLIDEEALVTALQDGSRLRGAALDVFCVEPLPESSPFWDIPNVLISPHNADMTTDFRHKSVKFFTENCGRFLEGKSLQAIVDKRSGY